MGIYGPIIIQKMENPSTKDDLTKKEQAVIEYASSRDRGTMDRELEAAIDTEDMDKINLILDAIQADYKLQQLLGSLPPQDLQELINYGKQLAKKQDNDRKKNNP